MKEEAIQLCKEEISKMVSNRKSRVNMDRRDYLIYYLYFEYNVKEADLAEMLGMKRVAINQRKSSVRKLLEVKSKSFLNNVSDLIITFPTLSEKERIKKDVLYKTTVKLPSDLKYRLKILSDKSNTTLINYITAILKKHASRHNFKLKN